MTTIAGNADLLRHHLNFTENSGGALFRDKDTHGLVGLHPPEASTPMRSARQAYKLALHKEQHRAVLAAGLWGLERQCAGQEHVALSEDPSFHLSMHSRQLIRD